jgi:two-component system nitrogen regulation sensor histidine kinase GlnL
LFPGGDTSSAYHFSTDPEFRIVSWGDKIASLTGKTGPQVLGRKYWEAFPRIFFEDQDALGAVLKSMHSLRLEKHNFDCLLGQIRSDISIEPVIEQGQVKSIEVTASFESICPLAERFRELQQIVDIGKTASTLAHGVRNPLNAIKGSVVYLRDKYPDEPPLIEFLKIIEYEISRLDTFISRFLSTSVSEADLCDTDINALMESIKVVVSFQARASRVHVVYEPGNIPAIKGNPFQIEQAILNVMNNALMAMSSGGLLRVRTFTEEKENTNFVVIEVSDTGPGILENRIGAVTSKNSNGKGFGLFITHEILKNHGGHLEVKSIKGAGTTMRLYLPL